MDTATFEATIKDYKLSFIKAVDNTAENRRLPSFLDSFNDMLNTNQSPPSQEDFINFYFWNNDIERSLGIEARARRAYASLVRESHLGLLLRENFAVLADDAQRDQLDGIDYVIDHNGKRFYIHAYVDTPRSNYYRDLKDSRRQTVQGGIHLDMKLNPGQAKEVGQFWLYGPKQVAALRAQMELN